MLRTVHTKRVCVRVTNEVEIVVIKSLHWRQVSAMLLRGRGEGHCWISDGRATCRAVPGEMARQTLLVNRVGRTVTLVLRGQVQFVKVLRRFRECANRAEYRLGDDPGLGL